MSENEHFDTLKEAKILKALSHPNFIRLREVYKTKKAKHCIVKNYADVGYMQMMI
jgi:NIMA (never in mitosis gene a)-related kinase 1/4/5